MLQLTYNDGGYLLTLFRFFGVGFTKVNNDDEISVTITFSIGKLNTFFTLAWL